jgi:hypothetical protein
METLIHSAPFRYYIFTWDAYGQEEAVRDERYAVTILDLVSEILFVVNGSPAVQIVFWIGPPARMFREYPHRIHHAGANQWNVEILHQRGLHEIEAVPHRYSMLIHHTRWTVNLPLARGRLSDSFEDEDAVDADPDLQT